jgi:hypothetical protein
MTEHCRCGQAENDTECQGAEILGRLGISGHGIDGTVDVRCGLELLAMQAGLRMVAARLGLELLACWVE